MLFSSMLFLWIFLPVVLGINFLFNIIKFRNESRRYFYKNIFLLISSMVFYAWGGIYYLFIMLSSILINYLGGYFIHKCRNKISLSKFILVITIVINLGMLFFFKYFNMVIAMVETVIGYFHNTLEKGMFEAFVSLERTGELNIMTVVLPIGISFFTFQAMSYVIDVYRKKAVCQKNILNFALYVSLFPQLIAGPIVQYSDIEKQLSCRKETLKLFASGQRRFCFGLAKKVIISNTCAEAASQIWKLDVNHLGVLAWFGVFAYALQIYYDFSGYSDMAIGIGQMLGFRFKENFNYPYTSLSVQEFWRRWHISLSSWFKEYVYIPLGGNRKSALCTYRNIFIVFLLTGIWHGANFTFLAWGIWYAVLQIIERLFLKKVLDKNPIKPINWLYTMLCVTIGWVFFNSPNIVFAWKYLTQMFSFSIGEYSILSYLSMKTIVVMGIGVLLCGFIQRPVKHFIKTNEGNIWIQLTGSVFGIAMLLLCILFLINGTYNPFIYFQF